MSTRIPNNLAISHTPASRHFRVAAPLRVLAAYQVFLFLPCSFCSLQHVRGHDQVLRVLRDGGWPRRLARIDVVHASVVLLDSATWSSVMKLCVRHTCQLCEVTTSSMAPNR